MSNEQVKIRSIISRKHAEGYLLTSLVSFAVTVIFTRVFLQLAGFPQIGNSVLHIAHALWGGLLLFVAVLLPLALANRWALQASAVLSGLGIGLFIDEVGKFITQTNDYFFAPALSLIYGFFLLCVFLFLLFRRSHQEDPRRAMYHAYEGLQDALDSDLDSSEAAKIEAQLAIAKRSDREEIVSLADLLTPNEMEARTLTGVSVKGVNEATQAARKLLESGVGQVIVTLGKGGSCWVQKDCMQAFPSFPVEAVDSTAAGDAFNGVLACAVAEGRPMQEAIGFASAAGAIAVTRKGAQDSLPTRDEMENLLIQSEG